MKIKLFILSLVPLAFLASCNAPFTKNGGGQTDGGMLGSGKNLGGGNGDYTYGIGPYLIATAVPTTPGKNFYANYYDPGHTCGAGVLSHQFAVQMDGAGNPLPDLAGDLCGSTPPAPFNPVLFRAWPWAPQVAGYGDFILMGVNQLSPYPTFLKARVLCEVGGISEDKKVVALYFKGSDPAYGTLNFRKDGVDYFSGFGFTRYGNGSYQSSTAFNLAKLSAPPSPPHYYQSLVYMNVMLNGSLTPTGTGASCWYWDN